MLNIAEGVTTATVDAAALAAFWSAQSAETLAARYQDEWDYASRFDLPFLDLEAWICWRQGWAEGVELSAGQAAHVDAVSNALLGLREQRRTAQPAKALRVGRSEFQPTESERWAAYCTLYGDEAPTWGDWQAAREREARETRERAAEGRAASAAALGLDPALNWSSEALAALWGAREAELRATMPEPESHVPLSSLEAGTLAEGARERIREMLS
ncbi:hypothetical protein [Microbacterium sp. No. 7]|uniref:hypothetical protein n=1 Tax=Microbacterium sp. No. 7 TaxID=1714373 RepID=UPI0006D042A6|nr:hypothetical protein [Microbacterium sp. No. 7]ALJ20645.1 hypothetical protein AOA12_12340 [Microbacterium sp. No. 7]